MLSAAPGRPAAGGTVQIGSRADRGAGKVSVLGRLWRRLMRRGGPGGRTRPVIAPVAAVRPAEPRRAGEVYTPTQPRTTRSMFIGRQREIETIVQALVEDRAHVVLYSERGRGKTSLANIIVEASRRSGLIVARAQCDAASTFDSLMRALLRSLPASLMQGSGVQASGSEGCEGVLPAGPVRPDDVAATMPKLRVRSLICVVDEFDRVLDLASRTLLADTIKQASDRGLPLLFMVIGVSDSLEQLIGQHPSINRNVVAVPLPLMSDENIAAVIETGAREAGLDFPAPLVARVADLSRGMPHAAHLLGLRVAQAAARRTSRRIEERDFDVAIERLVGETPHPVVQEYDDLVSGGTDAEMEAALAAVVRCRQDSWGHIPFTVERDGVVAGGVGISRRCWARLREAGVLRACEGKAGHLAFGNRAFTQYVLLRSERGAAAGGAGAHSLPHAALRTAAVAGSALRSA